MGGVIEVVNLDREVQTELHHLDDLIAQNCNIESCCSYRARFPADFWFQVTGEEFAALRSQFATSKGRGGRRYLPRVFTEHGALMAATVLNSERAVEMSLYLIRAFVQMRETLQANTSILQRLAEIDHHLIEHDSVLREVIERLQPLLDAPEVEDEPKPKIGFHPGNR
jgi:hypothetical protein